MIILKSELINRFTPTEIGAILAASDASIPVRVYLFKLQQSAQEIDLCSQEVIDGLNAMEAGGLIASGRANEILSGGVVAGVTVQILSPFDSAFPGNYSALKRIDGTYAIEGVGEFAPQYIQEVI